MNILIAIDFSEGTRAVLHAAQDWAVRLGSDETHLYLLHVAEPDPAFVGWGAGPEVVREQMAEVFQREHRELGQLVDGLQAEGLDPVTPLMVQGPTVDTILDQAVRLEASLIVIGSHGRSAALDILVGSVSSGVIRRSPVPVLVIPVSRSD